MSKRYVSLVIITMCWIIGIYCIKNSSAATDPTKKESGKKIIVYYFHGNYRCSSCIQVEKFTRKAVSIIQKQKSVYQIEIKVINRDLPENTNFVKKYVLENQSVIMADYSGEKQIRWKNCDKIWDFYTNEKDYIKYIRNEIEEYLN